MNSTSATTAAKQMPQKAQSAPELKPAAAQAKVRGGGPLIQASPLNQRVDLDSTAWAVLEP